MSVLMRRAAPLLVVSFLAMMFSGCLTNRRILNVNDHPTKMGTVIETRDTYSVAYIYPFKQVRQFWQCSDQGKTLKCDRICGTANADLECPTGFAVDGRFQSAR